MEGWKEIFIKIQPCILRSNITEFYYFLQEKRIAIKYGFKAVKVRYDFFHTLQFISTMRLHNEIKQIIVLYTHKLKVEKKSLVEGNFVFWMEKHIEFY